MFKKLLNNLLGDTGSKETSQEEIQQEQQPVETKQEQYEEKDDAPRYNFGDIQEDANNPLLQPIHGISLKDYGAAGSKMASGIEPEIVCKALGIELPVWEEVNTLWMKRMQEDGTFTVTSLYGKYFGMANDHPLLGSLTAAASAEGISNIERINNDTYFCYELIGARDAAYAHGLDGAQWIVDTFGVPLGEMQSAAMKWSAEIRRRGDDQLVHFIQYQNEKKEEYAARFAAEQGGNVADDIEF